MLTTGAGAYKELRQQVASIRGALRSAAAMPSLRYLNELTRLKCASDLLAHKLFPNAKEVTESFGAYNAARSRLRKQVAVADPSVALVAVGDGCTPRTAATFAYRSAWRCYSIDPRLRERWLRVQTIRRLHCVDRRVEDADPIECEQAVVVAVHSHAPLDAAIRSVRPLTGVVHVIAIPCCVEQWLGSIEPDECYADPGIWSPHCTVLVWRNVKVPC